MLDNQSKLILTNSNIIRSSLSSLSQIAKNSINSEDRVINFMCNHKHVILMASDSSIEAQINLKLNCNFKEVFAINFEKLNTLVHENEDLKLQVEENFITLEKNYCKIKLDKNKVNCKPFDVPEDGEVVSPTKFLGVLRSLRKYLTSELDDTSVIMINNQYTYARNRLFYVISDFVTKGQYIINRFSVNVILGLFNREILSEDPNLKLEVLRNEGKLLISNSIASVKVPLMRSNSVDLSSFAEIKNVNGYIVKKEFLIRNLQEMNAVEPTPEIDIVARDGHLTLHPSKEGTFTMFKVPADKFTITDGIHDFQYTVNFDSFLSMVRGSIDENLLFSSGSPTMLMMLNRSENLGVRYYMSVL